MTIRRDLIKHLLPTDDPDLVPVYEAQEALGMQGGEVYMAIFEGHVLGGPDTAGRLRVSRSGLAAHLDRVRSGGLPA